MSMLLSLKRASDEELWQVLRHPAAVHQVLYGVSGRYQNQSDHDLGKYWHGLHFLLTATAGAGDPPLNFLLYGGSPIGDAEGGYGPARALWSAKVRSVARALAALCLDDLHQRVSPADLVYHDIYPFSGSSSPPDQEDVLELIREAQRLREFLCQAAGDGAGLILYLH